MQGVRLSQDPGRPEQIGAVVGRLTSPGLDRVQRTHLLGQLAHLRSDGVRVVGARAALTGGWLSEVVADVAPHVPVRDLATLSEHHRGLTGGALAADLVRTASLATASVGAAGGALAALQYAAPPALLLSPLQLAAETVAVVAIELKLVAELHVVHGRAPLAVPSHVAAAYLQSWASRTPVDPTGTGPGLGLVLSTLGRVQLRRRVTRRLARNLSTMAPFLTGAVAAAELNRRETRRLGASLTSQLQRRP